MWQMRGRVPDADRLGVKSSENVYLCWMLLLAQRLRFLPHGDDPFMLPGGNWLGRAGPGRAGLGCCPGFAFYFLTSFMNFTFINNASADKAEVEHRRGRG